MRTVGLAKVHLCDCNLNCPRILLLIIVQSHTIIIRVMRTTGIFNGRWASDAIAYAEGSHRHGTRLPALQLGQRCGLQCCREGECCHFVLFAIIRDEGERLMHLLDALWSIWCCREAPLWHIRTSRSCVVHPNIPFARSVSIRNKKVLHTHFQLIPYIASKWRFSSSVSFNNEVRNKFLTVFMEHGLPAPQEKEI